MIWVSTNRGLFQLHPDVLLGFIRNPNSVFVYQYFDRRAGLYINEFNGGCNMCAVQRQSGEWVMPSMDGLVEFTPEAISPMLINPNVIFTSATSDGEPFSFGESLSHRVSLVEFRGSTPISAHHYSAGLEARLSGSKKCVRVGSDGLLCFVGLPPGEYVLEVRKPIDLLGTMALVNYSFVMKTPFWKTMIFVILMLLVIAVIIFLTVSLRLQFLRNRNETLEQMVDEQTRHLQEQIKDLRQLVSQEKELSEENERVVSLLAHDVRSPLRFLSMMSREFIEGKSQQLSSNLRVARETDDYLFKYVEDILELGRHPKAKNIKEREHVFVFDLVNKKVLMFKGMAKQKDLSISSDVPESLVVYTNQNIVSIVLHNLIDNAIKFTNRGVVKIY